MSSNNSMMMMSAGGARGGSSGGGGGRSWPLTTSVSSSGKRIQKEMSELSMDSPPYCSAGPEGDNLYHWVTTLFGPPGLFLPDLILNFLLFSHGHASMVVSS